MQLAILQELKLARAYIKAIDIGGYGGVIGVTKNVMDTKAAYDKAKAMAEE